MEASHDLFYPDMNGAADRIWHAARLFKAGKAPVVIPTGAGEDESSVPLLLDLRGSRCRHPRGETRAGTRLRMPGSPRRCWRAWAPGASCWLHRPGTCGRAQLLFERTGLEVIPAATDYEATIARARPDAPLESATDAAQTRCAESQHRHPQGIHRLLGIPAEAVMQSGRLA